VEQAVAQQKGIGSLTNAPAYTKASSESNINSKPAPLTLAQFDNEAGGRTIQLELIAPTRQSLGQFQIKRGQKFSLGKEELPPELRSDPTIASNHILIQLLENTQLIIRDTSPQNFETAATTYTTGDIESHQMMTLSKGLPVAFKFPVLVLLGEEVILGMYE